MAQSPRLSGRVDLAAAPHLVVPQRRNDRARPASRNADCDLARVTKANLLIVGTEQVVSTLIFSMWALFDGPVVVRRRGEPLQLPPLSQPVGTMVLYGVDGLTREEQLELYDWIAATAGRTRIVSTVSSSLLPMVQSAAFSDALYYRINTIWIDLTLASDPRRC